LGFRNVTNKFRKLGFTQKFNFKLKAWDLGDHYNGVYFDVNLLSYLKKKYSIQRTHKILVQLSRNKNLWKIVKFDRFDSVGRIMCTMAAMSQ
jgi:hypothetical protein